MKTLDEHEFHDLVKGGKVLTINGGGISVVRTVDNHIVKIFRPRSILSSDLYSPRPLRFEKAVKALKAREIPTVKNLIMCWVPCMKRHLAYYLPLEGEELGDALGDALGDVMSNCENQETLITQYAEFIARLHQKGIYFRGLNMKNTIRCTNEEFGLIDVGSVVARDQALNNDLRVRNLKHSVSYSRDYEILKNFGIQKFIKAYLGAALLTEEHQDNFIRKLSARDSIFAESIKGLC